MGPYRIGDLSSYACPSCVHLLLSFSSLGIECSRTWDWQLALTLQEGGVGVDELVGLDIADGDTRHVGGSRGCCRRTGWRMEADGVGRRVVVAGRKKVAKSREIRIQTFRGCDVCLGAGSDNLRRGADQIRLARGSPDHPLSQSRY